VAVDDLLLGQVEARARELLDPVHYDFFAGGAGDEVTLAANTAAFRRLALLPRVLTGRGRRELSIPLLGRPTALPVFCSPTAFHRLAHLDGECGVARAAAVAGVVHVVSMAATTAIEDIVAAARSVAPDPDLWFQLYLQPDREFGAAVVRRVAAAGVRALVVTVDSPVFGGRDRDDRNGFHDLPAGLVCENMRDADGVVRDIAMSADLDWSDLAWLRSVTDLPVLVKGVLHPLDAVRAVEAGAAGVIVSNHGGRQLDGVPATVSALPEVVAAVDGAIPVLLDGGVRRGTDVVKALALGATAVGIGRPVVWGLAAGGTEGVARVLELLGDELDRALALCGVRAPAELTPALVRAHS
jgi:4-hydroxymandelate oxidase